MVREFAVRQLDRLNDSNLGEVFLQLTQVLKYEPEHDSPLARMLLRRAIRNPLRLGHVFFWMLRSEMHLHCINERNGLLVKLYLQRCGPHKTTLKRQLFINESLTSIAQVRMPEAVPASVPAFAQVLPASPPLLALVCLCAGGAQRAAEESAEVQRVCTA